MTCVIDLSPLNLDWPLAIRRFQKDIREDFFPDPIHYQDLLRNQGRTADFLVSVSAAFQPDTAASYDIPKQNFTLRHAIHLSPVDRIVYQALVDRLAPEVDPKLAETVFSHRLRDPSAEYMFKNNIEQWKRFRAAVRDAARDTHVSHLVVTDIAQYYENIDFRKLKPQLENVLGGSVAKEHQACVDSMIRLLKRWTPYKYHGLPQNMDASSFVGNAFLDYIDRRVLRLTAKYFRYMDDIRILATSEAEARRLLMSLIVFLRELGLGVNARKTEIVDRDSARWHELMAQEDPSLDAIDVLIKSNDHKQIQSAVPKIVDKVRRLILEGKTGDGPFRFCINRLVTLRRYMGLSWPNLADVTASVLDLLVTRPCDTDVLCRYLAVAEFDASLESRLASLILDEPRCIYAWQNYHLWVLLVQRCIRTDALFRRAHAILETSTVDPNLSGACLYLGSCGEYSDRTAIKNRYSAEQPYPVRRAQLVALQELHAVEREPLFSGEREEPSFSNLAAYLDDLGDPVYVPDPPPVERDELYDFTLTVY